MPHPSDLYVKSDIDVKNMDDVLLSRHAPPHQKVTGRVTCFVDFYIVRVTVDQRGHSDAEAGHDDVPVWCLQQDLLVNQGVVDDVVHGIPRKMYVPCKGIPRKVHVPCTCFDTNCTLKFGQAFITCSFCK